MPHSQFIYKKTTTTTTTKMCNVHLTSRAQINSKSLISMEKYPLNGFTGKSLRREFELQKQEDKN